MTPEASGYSQKIDNPYLEQPRYPGISVGEVEIFIYIFEGKTISEELSSYLINEIGWDEKRTTRLKDKIDAWNNIVNSNSLERFKAREETLLGIARDIIGDDEGPGRAPRMAAISLGFLMLQHTKPELRDQVHAWVGDFFPLMNSLSRE